MSNFTTANGLQINGAGDRRALGLKVWAGEVLTAFREKNRFMDRHQVRTIDSGKSAQFPASWKVGSSYHTPGVEITGQGVNMNERTIVIDDMLISDVFVPNIDEAIAHYEYRSEYTFQQGAALARTFDKNVAQVMLLAARASATVTGGNGGTQITSATSKTSATALLQAIFDALQALDEKDVPEEDRCVFLKPAQYNLLVLSGDKAIDTDFNPGGNGSVASGKIYRVGGAEIVKTNNLPQSNVTTGPAAYQGDFSTVSALVAHRGAAGTVKLLDLAVESEYSVRHQGTLTVAKYALGHGILRPECAVEIKTA